MHRTTVAVCVVLAGAWLGAAGSAQADIRQLPLIEAVKHHDLASVRTLIGRHVNVNDAEPDGTTALHWAAHLNDAVATDLLIKAGADVKAQTRNGATPFALACYKGNAGVIERLLAAGADANAVLSGEPVLMMAARAGNPDAVRALLSHGADPNVVEPSRGQTALMWAAAQG